MTPPTRTRGRRAGGVASVDPAQAKQDGHSGLKTAEMALDTTPTRAWPSTGFVVVLPYPPTLNTLYRHVGYKTLLSAKGRRYTEVAEVCVNLALGVATNVVPPAPHAVTLLATPPDRRRRDLDNLPKLTLDLVYRAIGLDDSVIDRLVVEWRRDGRAPCVEVVIEPLATAPGSGGEVSRD